MKPRFCAAPGRKNSIRNLVISLTCSLVMITSATAKDIDGASDHPLVSRYAGAVITAYIASDFDAVRLPAGPVDNENEIQSSVELEGRVVRIAYRLPGEKTALEVTGNYQDALAAAGFETSFSCDGQECGRRFTNFVIQGVMFPRGFDRAAVNNRSRALLASKNSEGNLIHVFLYVMEDTPNARTLIRQVVVESSEMPDGGITIRDASALGTDLQQLGRAVVEGIFFDTDSANIRTESNAALEQMAELLTQDASLNVYIVGHTDNVGSLDYNMALSQRRAAAVTDALQSRYGIEKQRMSAKGVASLAPRASNDTEDGRNNNRRVELVLK